MTEISVKLSGQLYRVEWWLNGAVQSHWFDDWRLSEHPE